MINTLFLILQLSNLLLLLSFSTRRHMSVASPPVPFFQISLKNSELKTTHNNFRGSRAVHPTTFLKIAAYLQGQYFQHFFPFVCNIFLVYSLLWLYLLAMLSLLLFLQSLPGFQSQKPGTLIPCRMTGASRVFSYIVLTLPLYLSGCNSLVSVFPSDGSREWYIRWFRFFSNLIERSSGTAISCCSVLVVCPVSYFPMRGFQFFRFICLFCPTLFSLRASQFYSCRVIA